MTYFHTFLRPLVLLMLVAMTTIPASAQEGKVYGLGEFSLKKLSQERPSALYFLSPECPLCINYTVAMKQLQEDYAGKVDFYGVFPTAYYSKVEVLSYVREFGLGFDVVLDFENAITRELGATITPEVIVLTKNGEKTYSGKIDNWIISLGKKRQNVTRHYLDDALTALLSGKEVKVKKTEAVGCIIEQ